MTFPDAAPVVGAKVEVSVATEREGFLSYWTSGFRAGPFYIPVGQGQTGADGSFDFQLRLTSQTIGQRSALLKINEGPGRGVRLETVRLKMGYNRVVIRRPD